MRKSEYRRVLDQVKTDASFAVFRDFLAQKQFDNEALLDQVEPSDVNTIQQALGSRKIFRVLMEEFNHYVENQISNAKEE
jgi:hypothetical protein